MKRFFAFTRLLLAAFWLALLLAPLASSAQTRLSDIARRDEASGWIYFNPGVRMAPEAFFSTFQVELGLTGADHFELARTRTDGIGITHHAFDQYHEGIKVEGGVMLLHERNGELSTANGQIVVGIRSGARPSISVELVRQKSISSVGAKAYAWNDAALEAKLRSDTKSERTTHFPKPELIYVRKDRTARFSAENMTLAYSTLIYATEPFDLTDVYVDAHNGQVLYQQSRVRHCNHPSGTDNPPCNVQGSGETGYYGPVGVGTPYPNFWAEGVPANYFLANWCYNFETMDQGVRVTNNSTSALAI